MTPVADSGSAREICELQVTLLDVDPPVWRRVAVARTVTLADLHRVIQTVMGWANVHLHQFVTADGVRYEANDTETDPDSIGARTMQSCVLDATDSHSAEWARAEIPAAGGTGNARSVARVHSALACGGAVDGVRILSPEGVERALEVQTDGKDLVLGMPIRFGMGFGLEVANLPISPNPRAFFWGGWGGSLAIIDLDARVSIAYVMNRMDRSLAKHRERGNVR